MPKRAKDDPTSPDETHDKGDRKMLSPTQITTFMACPRKWYYDYVERLPVPEKFALVRGTVVHSVCEEFFQWKPAPGWSYDELIEHMTTIAHSLLKDFWAEQKVEEKFGNARYDETRSMIDRFLQLHSWKMEPLYDKYHDASKAWYFSKPKFRELHVVDKDLGVQGYIDAVIENEPGDVVLVDYKTSSLFKHTISEEHETQLYIYALLYEKETGVKPRYVSVEYLLYGKTVNYPVRDHLLDEIRKLVAEIHEKTRSKDKAAYHANTDYKFCKWCDFREPCQGQKPL